jgi:hypothetical protein
MSEREGLPRLSAHHAGELRRFFLDVRDLALLIARAPAGRTGRVVAGGHFAGTS